MSEIRCSDALCGKLLGVVKDGQLEIRCPRCNGFKRVPIADLVQELQVFLASLQALSPNGNGKREIEQENAKGFFL